MFSLCAIANDPATKIFIPVGDWNSHVGAATGVLADGDGGQGFRVHNTDSEREFWHLQCFLHQQHLVQEKSRLITCSSGGHSTPLDYIQHRNSFSSTVSNVQVLPKEESKNTTAGSVGLHCPHTHYGDVIMDTIASQITSLAIVFSTVYLDTDQRKHQSSASLAFVWGIHRGPVNSPHKWPVTRILFPFDDVIMPQSLGTVRCGHAPFIYMNERAGRKSNRHIIHQYQVTVPRTPQIITSRPHLGTQ